MNTLFKALSDPTRRQMLELLNERDMTVGEIASYFTMSKPSISQHLKILKHADLVIDEKKGQYVVYALNTTVFQEIVRWAVGFSKNDKGENK